MKNNELLFIFYIFYLFLNSKKIMWHFLIIKKNLKVMCDTLLFLDYFFGIGFAILIKYIIHCKMIQK